MSEGDRSERKDEFEHGVGVKHGHFQLLLSTLHAAAINKLLQGTDFRLNEMDCTNRSTSTFKAKQAKTKNKKTVESQHSGAAGDVISDSDIYTPASMSIHQAEETHPAESENEVGRRISKREKKPKLKVDLGYEEPKPIRGVKLSASAKEAFRKCEEILAVMK